MQPIAADDVDIDIALAIDIGGTKIAAGLVGIDGAICEARSIPTVAVAPDGDGVHAAEALWRSLAGLVDDVLSVAPPRRVVGVGVGCAGPVDVRTATVSPVNIAGWRAFPLVERLADHLGRMPVRLAGDGMCAAAGEHWHGAGRGVDDVLVVVVSTGVGGGLIQGGRLYAGPTGNAGHIGHMVVDLDGEECPCGGRGCVEAIASGPSMVTWALRSGWCPPTERPSAVDLAGSARAGDRTAVKAFERAGRALAAGLVSAAAVCDISLVVVGGGVTRSADLLMPPVRTGLREYGRLGFLREVTVREARLGVFAGLVGAAALVFAPEAYATPGVLDATPGVLDATPACSLSDLGLTGVD